jgi:hypothetical protein
MTKREKFRTERLVARPWRMEDLPLAMELWGDPAVTALIDSRGKLTNAQVGEKLRTEIERERSGGVQYWVLFDTNGRFRSFLISPPRNLALDGNDVQIRKVAERYGYCRLMRYAGRSKPCV